MFDFKVQRCHYDMILLKLLTQSEFAYWFTGKANSQSCLFHNALKMSS